MPAMPALETATTELDQALAWMAAWPLRSVEFALQAQRLQLEAWQSWQGSLQTLQREAWDWWTCHWAGGAPLDG